MTIKEHNIKNNKIILKNNKEITYEYLIFADGTNSFGNKYQKDFKKNIAMQLTFKSNRPKEIQIHFGITKRGYAWISSDKGITNVGLTDVFNKKTNYKLIFEEFLKANNLEAIIKDLKGAFTPIGIKKAIINDNIMFIGDAVGACDPLTLSGLRYALKTGEYAALAISKKNNKIYLKYINTLKIKFTLMKLLLKIFYLKIVLFGIFEIFR